VSYTAVRDRLPRWLRRYVLHFETAIDDAVAAFARGLPENSRILDAGAGEAVHARFFSRQRYTAVDLGIGDASWNYGRLDVIADLAALPFPDGTFHACINIVTLEHVQEPVCVLAEIGRVLKPGGHLLLVVPQEWEVHQSPHDFYRYTRHGLEYLLHRAGFSIVQLQPVGGAFRLLSRRLLNALQHFPGLWFFAGAVLLAPLALLLPLLDSLDRDRNSTLGYICIAQKR
jgi:Methylase involved in ubiquinone/menaquinone biosynthesis